MMRYLAFITHNPDTLLAYLSNVGCADLIVRRFSYGVEIDFHCGKPDIIHELETRFSLVRLDEFEEKTDFFTPDMKQELLKKETELVSVANDLISQERYWESHTVLENLWKSYDGSKKLCYQGIILVAASLVKYQMGNLASALSLYNLGIEKLIQSQMGEHILSQLPKQFSYPLFFKI